MSRLQPGSYGAEWDTSDATSFPASTVPDGSELSFRPVPLLAQAYDAYTAGRATRADRAILRLAAAEGNTRRFMCRSNASASAADRALVVVHASTAAYLAVLYEDSERFMRE